MQIRMSSSPIYLCGVCDLSAVSVSDSGNLEVSGILLPEYTAQESRIQPSSDDSGLVTVLIFLFLYIIIPFLSVVTYILLHL